MRRYRNLKMADVIEEYLGKILQEDFFIEGTLVTITGVTIDEKLLRADVKLGIIPHEKGPEVFEKINEKRGFLRRELIRIMNVRPVPHLHFSIDTDDMAT